MAAPGGGLARVQRERIERAAEARQDGHRLVFWAGWDSGAEVFKLVLKIYSGRARFPLRQETIARAETREGIERMRVEAMQYYRSMNGDES